MISVSFNWKTTCWVKFTVSAFIWSPDLAQPRPPRPCPLGWKAAPSATHSGVYCVLHAAGTCVPSVFSDELNCWGRGGAGIHCLLGTVPVTAPPWGHWD